MRCLSRNTLAWQIQAWTRRVGLLLYGLTDSVECALFRSRHPRPNTFRNARICEETSHLRRPSLRLGCCLQTGTSTSTLEVEPKESAGPRQHLPPRTLRSTDREAMTMPNLRTSRQFAPLLRERSWALSCCPLQIRSIFGFQLSREQLAVGHETHNVKAVKVLRRPSRPRGHEMRPLPNRSSIVATPEAQGGRTVCCWLQI